MVATFILVFTILFSVQFVGLSGLKLFAVVGAVVFAIGLSLGGATGYAINPVRDLVPRLTHCLLFNFGRRQRSSE
jgi:glycerol uptake facilitator protein